MSPTSVYLVRCRPSNKILTASTPKNMFVLGFMHKYHAELVRKSVSETSLVCGVPHGETLRISLEKKININKLPCFVQEKFFTEVLGFPLIYNIGVAFISDVISDDPSQILLESYPIQPIGAPSVYTHVLETMV